MKNNYTDELKAAIEELGGQKAVSERFKIPYRTVQNWASGVRNPPEYVAQLLIDHVPEKAINEDQETISKYKDKIKEKTKKIDEHLESSRVLLEQLNAMTELAQKRQEKIEANKVTIKQLEKALEATIEDLERERHAREIWARQAGTLTGR